MSWAELNERAEVTSAIDEPVRGIRVVKAFGREDKERARVADVTERAFKFSMSRARLLAGYDLFLKVTPILVQAGLLAVGAWMLASGRLTAGTFLLAFQLGTGLNTFASASTTSPTRGSTSAAVRIASPRCSRSAPGPSPWTDDATALDGVRAP